METASLKETIGNNIAKLAADPTRAKIVSFGSQTDTHNFVDEAEKALEFGFSITNNTSKNIRIAFAAGTGKATVTAPDADSKGSVVQTFDSASFLFGADGKGADVSKIGADCFLTKGTVYGLDEGTVGSADMRLVEVEVKDANRSIDQLTAFAKNTPFRFTRFVMNSSKLNGDPESSNYTNTIREAWKSPFEDTVEQKFNLRNIVHDKFQSQLLELDFQRDCPNLKAIMSNEHFLIIQVNAGTILNINAQIGAQLSIPQHFYRIVKDADNVVSAIRKRI